ncbi:MAG: PQQ-binding-like beta-propeller repeat protein [Pseudomonadota bacterium]
MSSFFNRWIQCVAIALVMMGLTSCASLTSSDKTENEPMPLSALNSEDVTFTKEWRDTQSDLTGTYAVLLSPTVSDDAVISASENGLVEARSLTKGHSIWRYKVKSKITAGLGSDVNHVYFVTSDFELIALNKKNGEKVWQVTLQSGVVATPVSNNLVLVVHGIDGKISGFDPHSGKNFWIHQQTIPELTQRGNSRPTFVANQWVVQGVDNGKVVVLRSQQGGLAFEVKVNTTANAAFSDLDLPVLATEDGLIVASKQKGLMMLSPSGEVLWQGRYKNDDIKSIALQGSNVLVVTESDKVYSHVTRTGRLNWINDALRHRGLSPASGTRSLVYVLDKEGVLHALKASSGTIVGRSSMKLGQSSNPVLIQGTHIVAMDDNGKLAVYMQTGRTLSKMMSKKVKIKASNEATKSTPKPEVKSAPKSLPSDKAPAVKVEPVKREASKQDVPSGKVPIRRVKVKVNKPSK